MFRIIICMHLTHDICSVVTYAALVTRSLTVHRWSRERLYETYSEHLQGNSTTVPEKLLSKLFILIYLPVFGDGSDYFLRNRTGRHIFDNIILICCAERITN